MNKIDPHYTFADFFEKASDKVLAYELSTRLQEGNICVPSELFENLVSNPFLSENEKYFSIEANELIGEDRNSITPFINYNNKYYLQRYFVYETEILEKIEQLIANEDPKEAQLALSVHMDFIKELFSGFQPNAVSAEENIDWQCVGAINAVTNNFSIITGGPGTGKTTTVAKLLAIIYTMNPEAKVLLTAPTGKASARMKESLQEAKEKLAVNEDIKKNFENIESGTIHSQLGSIRNSHYFKHNSEQPLPFDVVIVDESSMISSTLMAKLLGAIKPTTKIIFLGDKNQLASVEAGSIFGDFCLAQPEVKFKQSNIDFINQFIKDKQAHITENYTTENSSNSLLNEHIVELKRSYRFQGEEAIGLFSKAIIENNLTDTTIEKCDNPGEESVAITNIENEQRLEQMFEYYKEYILEKDIKKALKKINLVKFLCATKKGNYGVENFNKKIENYLQDKGLLRINSRGFYENQPILITKNNRALKLFNGDIGIVRKNKEGKYTAYFEGGETGVMSIPCNRIDHYKTVFAMTIHKSQGSEFKHVGIVLTDNEDMKLLTRELIYTGVTRAKETALIVGSKDILQKGIARTVERASGLTERLTNAKN